MYHLKEYWGVYLLILLWLILCAGVISVSKHDRETWDAFAKEHNCKEVEFAKGQVSTVNTFTTGVNGNINIGIATVVSPDMTCWACDDGKRYWRESR